LESASSGVQGFQGFQLRVSVYPERNRLQSKACLFFCIWYSRIFTNTNAETLVVELPKVLTDTVSQISTFECSEG
ncbi:hypothetical protein PC123_g28176, partial [Phytophthora cactorum]